MLADGKLMLVEIKSAELFPWNNSDRGIKNFSMF